MSLGTARTRKADLPGARVFKFGVISFWTEKGLIILRNDRADEEKVIAPTEAKLRAISFYNEGKRMIERPGPGGAGGRHYKDEAYDLLRMAKALMECYKECKAFGDPYDPDVAAREADLQREIKMHVGGGQTPPRPQLITPDSPEFNAPALTSFLKK